MASSHRASDALLAECCECSLKALADLQRSVIDLMDAKASPFGDRTDDLLRTMDAIGAFRFPRDWETISPNRKRAKAHG